jgi:hypothetical protein
MYVFSISLDQLSSECTLIYHFLELSSQSKMKECGLVSLQVKQTQVEQEETLLVSDTTKTIQQLANSVRKPTSY